MKRKVSKYIFLTLAVFAIVVTAISFGLWNTPHQNIKDAVALKTNAAALYKSLANDSSYSKSLYINKIIAVTGEVKQVMENHQKQQVILLRTGIKGSSVNCTMEQNIENIKEGETVTLKGICIGYSGEDRELEIRGDVFMVRCYRS